jgi:hypothetical protein
VWTSESLPVLSYNKTRYLLFRSLSTSLLQMVSIGLCHYEICVGSEENKTDYFFGGKYPLVYTLLGKPLSYFFVTHWKSLAQRMWSITSILQWHQQVYSSHITQQILGTPCNIPILSGSPIFDWYIYIANYSMQNSPPLCGSYADPNVREV